MINGKIYIGFTGRTLDQRWKGHLSAARQGSPFRFHSAIRKYGPDPWERRVISENEEITTIRHQEEIAIAEYGSMDQRTGYNAKPGGCGGWIVPANKFDARKRKLSANNIGSKNGNALSVSNDDLISLAVSYTETHGFIPGHNRLMKFGSQHGVPVPKSFTPYRFDGTYKNLAKKVEEITGIVYNPYYRDEAQRKSSRDAFTGKRWFHNEVLKISRLCHPDTVDSDWLIGKKDFTHA